MPTVSEPTVSSSRSDKARAECVEALGRARGGLSTGNYGLIFAGFTAKGIPAHDILPRENVLTFKAWRAIGRTVKRGEKGVRVTIWRTGERKNKKTGKDETYSFPWSASVFHISQTVTL